MTRIYEFKREKRIQEIQELLKNMERDGEKIDRKKIIIAIMARYLVSDRTAVSYLNVAQFKNVQS